MEDERTVYTGGWFQRTSLYLEDVYNLLIAGQVVPNTGINPKKLKRILDFLDIEDVKRINGYLDFILIQCANNITVKIFEDGVYTIKHRTKDFHASFDIVKNFNNNISELLNRLFSRGAPMPRITEHFEDYERYFVLKEIHDGSFEDNETMTSDQIVFSTNTERIYVKATDQTFFINHRPEVDTEIIVEMQIFFEEVKNHLKEFKNEHNNIWELVTNIRKLKGVKMKEVFKIKNDLNRYQTIVDLSRMRIEQMKSFIKVRGSISQELHIVDELNTLFSMKLVLIESNLNYVAELWNMTDRYLQSALKAVDNIVSKRSEAVITTFRVLATLWTTSAIFGYTSTEEFPQITNFGVVYFIFLLLLTVIIEFLVRKFVNMRTYKVKIENKEIYDDN